MSWNIRIVALTSAVIVWSSSVAAYWVAGGRFTHDLNWSFAQPDDGANAAALALPAAFEQIFEHDATPRAAHSPALTEIGHTLVVSWFEGTREGAKDVEIKRVELSGHRDGQLTVRSLPAFDMAASERPDPRQHLGRRRPAATRLRHDCIGRRMGDGEDRRRSSGARKQHRGGAPPAA
jgi:hypothetical protein